jgi:hypothetical protein
MIPKNLTLAFALGGAVIGTAAVAFLPPSQVILVLCGFALLGAVLFFWNSLRTLGGDTDIPDEAARTVEHGPLEAMLARKKMLLLSLKDLDNERKLGKILPADFDDVSYRYREEVKALMRQIDAAAEPFRARAEDLAKKHLLERGMMPEDDNRATADTERATVRVDRPLPIDEPGAAEPDASDDDAADSDDKPVDSRAITKPNAPPVQRPSDRPPRDDKDDKAEPKEPLLTTQKSVHLEAAKPDGDSRRTCPSCNASNEQDAKFCKECATPLKKAEPAVEKTEGATDA